MKKIILLCFFAANCKAANIYTEKWKYTPPEPASLENKKTKEYKKSTSKKIESEIETTKKANSFSYVEKHSSFTTYYTERINPVTNETEFVTQGMTW